MARQIGKELIDRLRHMTASLESIQGGDSDSPEPLTDAERALLEARADRLYSPGVTAAAADEAKRLRLTDAEREAINMARSIMLVEHDLSVGAEVGGQQPRRSSGYWWTMADSLRGLLERTRNGLPDGCETGQ